jgi:hypothetical protein
MSGGPRPPRRGPPARRGSAILLGVLLIARGRAEGLAQFGNTSQAFLASLAPLVAFPLVGGMLLAIGGDLYAGIVSFLETMCVLLAQPVISEALAGWWGRGDLWLRYATAFNWCQWAIPALASVLVVLLGLLLTLGMPPNWAGPMLLAGLGGYGLWLQWFLGRHALMLSHKRAAILVVLVNLGTAALLLGPRLFLGLG